MSSWIKVLQTLLLNNKVKPFSIKIFSREYGIGSGKDLFFISPEHEVEGYETKSQRIFTVCGWKLAREYLARFDKSGAGQTEAQFYLGECYGKLAKNAEALEAYEAFVKRYPEHKLIDKARDRISNLNKNNS